MNQAKKSAMKGSKPETPEWLLPEFLAMRARNDAAQRLEFNESQKAKEAKRAQERQEHAKAATLKARREMDAFYARRSERDEFDEIVDRAAGRAARECYLARRYGNPYMRIPRSDPHFDRRDDRRRGPPPTPVAIYEVHNAPRGFPRMIELTYRPGFRLPESERESLEQDQEFADYLGFPVSRLNGRW